MRRRGASLNYSPSDERVLHYRRQNGCDRLTPRQRRRVIHKGNRRGIGYAGIV